MQRFLAQIFGMIMLILGASLVLAFAALVALVPLVGAAVLIAAASKAGCQLQLLQLFAVLLTIIYWRPALGSSDSDQFFDDDDY